MDSPVARAGQEASVREQQHPCPGHSALMQLCCRSNLSSCNTAQVTVTLAVENSRRACDAVARGEADCALIGGEVPRDLADALQVQTLQTPCLTLPARSMALSASGKL